MDVADVDDDGDLDIIVGNLDTPNVVYFQDGTPAPSPPDTPTSGDFTTTTPIGNDPDSPTTKVVAADLDKVDLDKDGKVDLVVANRDEENLIFLAKDAPGGVLDNGRACPMRPPARLQQHPRAALYNKSYVHQQLAADGFLGAECTGELRAPLTCRLPISLR